jgi:hypothetical protein
MVMPDHSMSVAVRQPVRQALAHLSGTGHASDTKTQDTQTHAHSPPGCGPPGCVLPCLWGSAVVPNPVPRIT